MGGAGSAGDPSANQAPDIHCRSISGKILIFEPRVPTTHCRILVRHCSRNTRHFQIFYCKTFKKNGSAHLNVAMRAKTSKHTIESLPVDRIVKRFLARKERRGVTRIVQTYIHWDDVERRTVWTARALEKVIYAGHATLCTNKKRGFFKCCLYKRRPKIRG